VSECPKTLSNPLALFGLEGFLEWLYMLSDAQITKFQTLYKEQFGKEISRKEALEKGIKLMRLVELVYKPITQEEYEAVQRDRQETPQKDSKKFKDNKII